MLDFSKWVDMWDAYYARGISGGAVPGSAASICWNIGFWMILFGLLPLIILIIVFPVAYVPAAKGISIFSTVIPSNLTVRANHQDMESGRFGRMQERQSKTAQIPS